MLMIACLLGTVLCDVAGQLCFKIGVGHHEAPQGGLFSALLSKWIAFGILLYVVEFTVWFAALTLAPLSLAFPVMALSYCGVVVASRFVLKEHVSTQRWFATLTIAIGVSLVCAP
jgi:undecaprenyl phosphate-alpha-L-ara4N flippase subunit ArnE